MSRKYCLRWNDHGSHFPVCLTNFLHDESMTDVVLCTTGDGGSVAKIRAHRLVLAACSTLFENLFSGKDGFPANSSVVVCGVTAADLKALVDYMYKGEICVNENSVDSLTKAAMELGVHGFVEVCKRLRQMNELNGGSSSDDIPTTPATKKRKSTKASNNNDTALKKSRKIEPVVLVRADTKYSAEKIKQAVEEVVTGRLSLRKAAEKMEVPKTVLWRRVRMARWKESVNKRKCNDDNDDDIPYSHQSMEDMLLSGEDVQTIMETLQVPLKDVRLARAKLVDEGKLTFPSQSQPAVNISNNT